MIRPQISTFSWLNQPSYNCLKETVLGTGGPWHLILYYSAKPLGVTSRGASSIRHPEDALRNQKVHIREKFLTNRHRVISHSEMQAANTFMPSPTDRCVGGIMLLGCTSVSACFRACVLLAWLFTNQWIEFHQTSVDDVVEATDKLSFEGRGVKAKVKVTAKSNI